MLNGSIQAPNPNPRPPNEPRVGNAVKVQGAQPNRHHVGISQHQNLGSKGRNTGSKGSGAGGTATQSPSSPPSPQLAPPTDPRDAEYWQNVAQLEFNKNNILGRIGLENQYSKSNFDREQANFAYQEPREVLRLKEQANQAGGLYSTSTQERLGELGQEQFNRRASSQEAYQQALQNRINEGLNAGQNYGKQVEAQGLGASERASAAELNRPSPYVEEALKQYATGHRRRRKK